MAKKVNRPFCVIYKRTDAEKRAWNMSKELDEQKSEIEEIKRELEALKASNSTTQSSTSTKKKSNKETD